jgi:hypothetical protein
LDGNFQDEAGHAVKPHAVEDYNAHMGFVDKSDGKQLWHCSEDMEMVKEVVFPSSRYDYSKCISITQVM